MAATSNYGNNYPPSNNYSSYGQQNGRFEDPRSQMRSPVNASNPYYDNTIQYNNNISRGGNRNLSSERPNQNIGGGPMEPESIPPSNRNYPEESRLAQYSKPPLQQQNGQRGSAWGDNFGQNNNHNRIQKDYQSYVKNYDSIKLSGKPSVNANSNTGQYGENVNRSPLRKKDVGATNNQPDSWYIQNYNVGILPGMGGGPDPRRPGKMSTIEVRPPQSRQIEQYDGRPGTYDAYANNPGIQGNPGGSRLAGIGSRLIDSQSPYKPEQLRIPQEPQDYGMRENAQNYQTPQYALNKAYSQQNINTPQYRPAIENKNYTPEPQNYGNDQRFSEKRQQRNQGAGDGGDQYGTNWLVERNRQEEDKKTKQRDELQRIYREQIEEKSRKKDEEKRRKFEEERREDERLRKENDELNRQFQLEQQQKKQKNAPVANVQAPKQNVVEEDFLAQKRPQNQVRQSEMSGDNPMRNERYEQPNDENNLQLMRIEDVIKSSANHLAEQLKHQKRLELYTEPELNVHRATMERHNFVLDEELQKMRRNLEMHSTMLKNEMSSYKTQALVAQELRQNAQRDLMRLREELKNQQLQEERRPYEGFEFNANEQQFGKNTKQPDNSGLRLPMKNYTKLQAYEDEGEDLGKASQGFNLEVETAYVPVRKADVDLPAAKEAHGLTGLLTKHGIKEDKSSSLVNDAAMHKFGQLFPDHKNQSGQASKRSDARADHNLHSIDKAISSHSSHVKGSNHLRQEDNHNKPSYSNLDHDEDGDNIKKLDGLLDTYQDKDDITHHGHPSQNSLRHNQAKKIGELPVRHEEKVQQHLSNNHIKEEINGDVEEAVRDSEQDLEEDYDLEGSEEGEYEDASNRQSSKR